MRNQDIKNKKGFTIIEVVLVLGIAGLIFLMVFIALPALARNRRDTQRVSDISRLATAITNYQSNNSGAIPSDKYGNYVSGHADVDQNITRTLNHQSWAYFYDSYLLISAEAKDKFVDPDGDPYSLSISSCREATSYDASTKICNNGQRSKSTWIEQSEGRPNGIEDVTAGNPYEQTGSKGHTISIVTNATCEGEDAVHASGSRKVAILYKKEGGGSICNAI